MLVVSRKQDEKILFPNLGIAVEVLRVAGKTVRVGVDAPKHIRVLRGELANYGTDLDAEEDDHQDNSKKRHQLRNRLNAASLSLHILQKQLDAGRFSDAESTLEKAINAFTELDRIASLETSDTEPAAVCHRRALVVEDNANERELLVGYLELCGYEVEAVEDGVAAIDHLSNHKHPDIILIDMQMPRMNGRDTITEIRCNPDYRGIKVFAVSGMDREEMGVSLGDRGVDRWFSKPLKPSQFANQLREELVVS